MNFPLAQKWVSWTPYFQSLLRIVAGLMFLSIGTMKLFSFPWPIMSDAPGIPWLSLMGIAGMLETVGGALMLLGLFTRPVAFILAGEMAFAYFIGHFPQGFWPILNNGQPAVLYCFIWLYFSAAGAGPWSIDAAMKE